MKRAFLHIVLVTVILMTAVEGRGVAQQVSADEQQTLRTRIEQRYDVVPISGGVALTPKTARADVRLISDSDTIAVNGVAVSGRELRERVGADADAILRLWDLGAQRSAPAVHSRAGRPARPDQEPALERTTPATPEPPPRPNNRRSNGDRVRVLGSVVVNEGEEVSGQVVAVLGSAHVNGEVGDQVVAVLGDVELGPHAIVRGDVVSVGGRLRRAPGAQVHGSVTEVSLGGLGTSIHVPWMAGWGPVYFGGFGPIARLIGTTFRFVLLALVACVALVVARRAVEGSAQRVVDDPIKATLVGLVAWVLFVPMLVLIASCWPSRSSASRSCC